MLSVSHRRATLTGAVDTWPECQQAASDAYEAGARDVNNHLRVLVPAATVAHEPQPTETLGSSLMRTVSGAIWSGHLRN